MHPIDWLFVFLPLVVVGIVTAMARRHLKGVADFMAGGRLAGRYLLSTARGEMGAGAIAYVALFEWFGHGGFSITWWNQLAAPVGLILSISGFVVYRYRQTRALTLAQFFEMRYSRGFRLFTGLLAFGAGLLNFGVIPVIGAKFVAAFLGLPSHFHLLSLAVPTYLALMAGFLTVTVLITITGGQITILVADCIQGMFSQVFYIFIGIALLVAFNWDSTRAMLLAPPPGHSLVNPFDSFGVKDFNIWYVLIGLWGRFYTIMAWQNNQGFNSAAATPHESRMGYILGNWRGYVLNATSFLLAISAMTYVHSAGGAAKVDAILSLISDPQTAEQVHLPVALSLLFAVGIKGLFLSVVLMGIFGGDGQHLHSWGSIFAQDVVLPLCRKPLGTRAHIVLLRLSIVGVALFAFVFGALFTQTEYLPMWFNVTMAIYIGGAGACIIGGLYWSRGTTAGAWAGLLTGSVLSVGGIVARQLDPHFPLNGILISFLASLAAVAAYVVFSLLTCRTPHDMDRLLHRGRHAVEPEAAGEPLHLRPKRGRFHPYTLVGIDEHFTRGDRWATLGIFFWSLLWFGVFAVGSVAYLVHPWSNRAWAEYWLYTSIYLPLFLSFVTTVWFTVGCWKDLVLFFRRLKTERPDAADDGTVGTGH